MGKVIHVDFNPAPINLDEDFNIEIIDTESLDSYFYFEEDMIPEPTETESFKALGAMLDEFAISDFTKRY